MKNEKGKGMAIGILALLLYLLLMPDEWCVFKRTLGIPCLGCGMTRAYLALLHGEVSTAFFFHPLFWLVPILLLLFWQRKRFLFVQKNTFWIVVGSLFLLVYVVRMMLLFPHTPPMNFNEQAILPSVIEKIPFLFKNR
ncbi:DUF2752 domain-containing protein [Pilibacter termitis]|uniref:DUF2752 domain-containing protein n=1 Tax=Pilibacter termitis TaxID=263852 RepID=UPI00135657DB|nr:DUF2752 domain-containing protein [Pilibacter termitis]